MATKKLTPKQRENEDAKFVAKKSDRELRIESLANMARPKVLDDLVGQDHVATQIRGMFESNRIPPVFIITGDSGVGKTTTARLIARYLLCTRRDSKTHNPCGECAGCKAGTGHPDLNELNAADQRGIDEMRQLVQSAKNMPTLAPYRIILLDEAHRITDQAAPVLLKPLEDPPPRTIWMLATTNPEKLPSTILGRCHSFQLKRIEVEVIVKRLSKIARKNGVDFKEIEGGKKVLETIANFAYGSMRNAISMLDIALFAVKGGAEIDTKAFISTYVTSDEGTLEKQSVEMVIAVLSGDMKSFVRSVRQGGVQPRGLVYKSRFLVQYLLDAYAGVAKFVPYPARVYADLAKKADLKPSIYKLMQLQLRLVEIEQRMNTMSLDESIQLMVGLGGLIKGE